MLIAPIPVCKTRPPPAEYPAHMVSYRTRQWVIGLTSLLSLCTSASAQSDQSMLLTPWEDNRIVEARGSAMIFDRGHMENNSGGMHLTQVESSGRWRFDTKHPIGPTVGYDYLLLSMSDQHQPFPAQLTDTSFSAGTPFLYTHGWFFMAGGGAGYAGDEAFGNGDAWYGRGFFLTGRELSTTSQILFTIDYNGNRTIFPDIPMPAGIYHKSISDNLDLILGPVMGVIWSPTDRLTLDLRYEIPDVVDLLAKYKLNHHWSLYATFQDRRSAFHADQLPSDRRLFFHQRRAEAGLHFTPWKFAELTLAAGYAFDQEFERGWDLRDLDHIADLSDEPYLRLGLALSY